MTGIKPWHRTSDRVVADCRIFTVNESASVSPVTGETRSFYFISTADWVNIVPMTQAGEVVLIQQFRHGSESITLEIPGGMVDPGEVPQVAAVRECLEESGFQAGEVASLGVLNPNPALFPNRLHTFVAQDCRQVAEIANSSTEHTEVVMVPFSELPELLMSGKIEHALVVATLWRLLYQQAMGDG